MPTEYRVKIGAPLLRPGVEVEAAASEGYVVEEIGKLLDLARASNRAEADRCLEVEAEQKLRDASAEDVAAALAEEEGTRDATLVVVEAKGLLERIARDHGVLSRDEFACEGVKALYDALEWIGMEPDLPKGDPRLEPDVPDVPDVSDEDSAAQTLQDYLRGLADYLDRERYGPGSTHGKRIRRAADIVESREVEVTEGPASDVERLAGFVLAEIPGEPSENEGAVDCAIRLLRRAYVEETQGYPLLDLVARHGSGAHVALDFESLRRDPQGSVWAVDYTPAAFLEQLRTLLADVRAIAPWRGETA